MIIQKIVIWKKNSNDFGIKNSNLRILQLSLNMDIFYISGPLAFTFVSHWLVLFEVEPVGILLPFLVQDYCTIVRLVLV